MATIRYLIGCLASLALLMSPARAGAEERYYFGMLACQEENKVTHTFALLIKTTDEGEGGKNCILETKTMCSTAASLSEPEHIQLKPAKPLHEVLEGAHSLGARIAIWGPYPVQKGFYDKALKGVGREGGLAEIEIWHDLISDGEMTTYLRAVANAGKDSNRPAREANWLLVVRGLEPWIRPRGKAPDWLHERLELKKYGVQSAEATGPQ